MARQPTLLAVNVGNTNVTLGLFAGPRLVRCERVPVARLSDGLRPLRRRPGPDAVAIASVNPPASETAGRLIEDSLGIRPHEVGGDIPVPIRVRCRFPERVGVDRLLNALSARSMARGPVVVADLGTAITVDAVSAKGDFLGGTILPGVALSARALHEGTAKLPLVRIGRPRSPIGKQTEDAITSGIYWGTCGAVKEIVEGIRRRLRDMNALLVVTGGDASLFASCLPRPNRLVPELTLMGIATAFERWRD